MVVRQFRENGAVWDFGSSSTSSTLLRAGFITRALLLLIEGNMKRGKEMLEDLSREGEMWAPNLRQAGY